MYVDPKAGRVTLSAFYATWASRQVWAPGTELAMSLAVRSATFRDVELRALRRSHGSCGVIGAKTTSAWGESSTSGDVCSRPT